MAALENETGLTFRYAAPDDVDAVVALVHSAYRGESSRQGWASEADLVEGQRTDVVEVREIIDADDGLLLLALREGAIIGSCQLMRLASEQGAYFGMFAVRPDLQGSGFGKVVLAEAERTARARWGARTMRLTVIRQREELIAWYRRRGYEPTGELEPFPYGDERFGIPLRDDLEFIVLAKRIG